MKRLILIIILIIVALLGVAYFVFTGQIGNPLSPSENQQAVGDLPGDNVDASGTFVDDTPSDDIDDDFIVPASDDNQPTLLKVVSGPIAGYTAYQKRYIEIVDDERVERTRLTVTYVDRTNGNVIKHDVFDNTDNKLSNTTITRLQSAEVGSNGLVIGRSIGEGDVVQTFIGRTASSSSELSYAYIDNNLLEVHLSPNLSSLLIGRVSGGKYQAVITTTSGLNGKVIFESPISEWKLAWRDNSSVIVTSKTAYGIDGISYLVTTAGAKTLIASGVPGLQVTAAPTGNRYLIGSFYRGGPSTHIQSASGNVSTTATLLAEKCIWKTAKTEIVCGASSDNGRQGIPDGWYKGLIQFSEQIVVTDGITGTTRIIETPQRLDPVGVDVINPQLVNDQYFFFMNKRDGSLWMSQV